MKVARSVELRARRLTEHGSNGRVSFVGRGDAQVVQISLDAGGRVGMHAAARDQLLVVVDGAGIVRVDGDSVVVGQGDVVRFAAGEEHETSTESGLVAVVVEAAALELG